MTALLDLLAQIPNQAANAVPANSPMNDFTASAVIYVLIVGALVVFLLGAGLLIVNLGLLSKREEDHTGGRTPSDVAVLKNSIWPPEREDTKHFPAVDRNDPYSVYATRGHVDPAEEVDLHEGDLVNQLGQPITPDMDRELERERRKIA